MATNTDGNNEREKEERMRKLEGIEKKEINKTETGDRAMTDSAVMGSDTTWRRVCNEVG